MGLCGLQSRNGGRCGVMQVVVCGVFENAYNPLTVIIYVVINNDN